MQSATPVSKQRFLSRENTEVELKRLLKARLNHPENAAAIDAEILATFVETHAVINLDMSGFSRLTRHQGIICTLAEIQRMRDLVTPIVSQHQGTVVKQEADNIYAVFPSTALAVAGAIAILQALAVVQTRGSIGIGYGDLIMMSDGQQYVNAYGDQMNLAAKLGEDLAEVDEVLLTEEAFEQLQSSGAAELAAWQAKEVTISQLPFQVYGLAVSLH
jgi:class 3 adenylate cyclase